MSYQCELILLGTEKKLRKQVHIHAFYCTFNFYSGSLLMIVYA